jgi:hypothetical protein
MRRDHAQGHNPKFRSDDKIDVWINRRRLSKTVSSGVLTDDDLACVICHISKTGACPDKFDILLFIRQPNKLQPSKNNDRSIQHSLHRLTWIDRR